MKKSSKPKSRKKAKPAQAPADQSGVDRRSFLRRTWLLGVGAVALGVGGYVSVQSVMATMTEHDLSVLGDGRPTVVQVHDPNCALCRSLQKETRAALKGFEDGALRYLIANINTPDGQALASKHLVPHVTLLLFDGDGTLRDVIRGVTPRETLHDAFAAHLQAAGRG